MISVLVAHANKQVIGMKNELPWYLPADLKRFKELTTGHTVIMGRTTFDSIMKRLGHPLPNRKNIVISRTLPPSDDYIVVPTIAEAIRSTSTDDKIFIIGGAQIYKRMMPLADRIYLTKIDADIPGDTFFPRLEDEDWAIESIERFAADEQNPYPFRYINLVRKV